MSKTMSIQLYQVSKRFGSKEVVSEVSLEIQKGELFGLLGPSGAGKSTMVKIIAGIDESSAGQTHVLGEQMPNLEIMAQIGYMSQSEALYAELTAQENMQFFAALYGVKGAKCKQRIKETASLVHLSEHLHKQVSQYSGGMKRRLSLAISMLHEPKVLILDEPTVGIDPVLRRSIWIELNKLRTNGTTILLTTHVMDEAEKCQRLGMIRDGRLIASGTPEDLLQATRSLTIEAAFLHYGGVSV